MKLKFQSNGWIYKFWSWGWLDSEKDDIDEQSSDSENSFFDDREVGNEADFYRFQNVENDIQQVLVDTEKQALTDIDQFDEMSNLCDGSDDESPLDELKEFEVDLRKFEETLFPRVGDDEQKYWKPVLQGCIICNEIS